MFFLTRFRFLLPDQRLHKDKLAHASGLRVVGYFSPSADIVLTLGGSMAELPAEVVPR